MTLTPQDVHNKQFSVVRLREGYDQAEVDEFLDEVEAELRRILEENQQMRGGQPAPAGEADVDAAREAAEDARLSDTELREAVRDTSDAPAAALSILTHAQTAADNLIDEAQQRADELIGDATQRAQDLDAETERRREELLGDLKREEQVLRVTIDDLRSHEREYRSRLIAYHSEQVRTLSDGQQPEAEAAASEAASPVAQAPGESSAPAEPSPDEAPADSATTSAE